MSRYLMLAVCVSLFAIALVRGQDPHGDAKEHEIVRPAALKWAPAPVLPAGAMAAVVVGEPGKAGVPYVIRVKLPAGFKVPPHWHPSDENVTVLQGTLLIGKGDKFSEAALEEVPVGAYMRMPKTMRHFAMAKGDTVLQVHGVGPFEFHYVNAADDPRKQEKK